MLKQTLLMDTKMEAYAPGRQAANPADSTCEDISDLAAVSASNDPTSSWLRGIDSGRPNSTAEVSSNSFQPATSEKTEGKEEKEDSSRGKSDMLSGELSIISLMRLGRVGDFEEQ